MYIPLIDLKAQYDTIKDEIKAELNDVLESTSFILGDKVESFERNFAAYCNKKFAVCVNSGTSALHLALLAKGVGLGDEVITSPLTFIATAEAISYTGAQPVFVDINPTTYNIDPAQIECAITKKTKAIIPVHLCGQSANMLPITEIAEQYGIEIIEDCCQAHGAEYSCRKVPIAGTGCFSFYPSKNLGAYGEGGAVVTDNEKTAQRVKMLRNHGEGKRIGYNYRMDGFQGAVLGVKLKYLDYWIHSRIMRAELYNRLLKGVVETPSQRTARYCLDSVYAKHTYHLYVINSKRRDELARHLEARAISARIHYPVPIHLQQAYSYLGLKEGSFPKAEAAAKQMLSLPIYPELSGEQINYVAQAIREVV